MSSSDPYKHLNTNSQKFEHTSLFDLKAYA